jgi:aryl-alcohol dehydrogenase-like predicted oxidoreductase
VSWLGLGTSTWGLDTAPDACAGQLLDFVEAGGTLVDTATVYGGGRSEEIVGSLLGRTVARADLTIATKAGLVGAKPPFRMDASASCLLAQLDRSLRRLRSDHVDLWQVHGWDDGTPLEETLGALDRAVTTGRARFVGVCNYSGWKTAKAAMLLACGGGSRLASVEVEYSLLRRGIEREVVPAATDLGLGVLAWAPLGRGVLTGKYRAGVPADRRDSRFFQWYVRKLVDDPRSVWLVETLVSVAGDLGVPPAAVALSWVRDRPGVTAALVGARTPEQLRESLRATAVDLPADARTQLDALTAPDLGYPERSG